MSLFQKKCLMVGGALTFAFILFTLLIGAVDVQPIGENGSLVGFAALNGAVRDAIGVRMTLYKLTDILGILPILTAVFFAGVGLYQWITRKSLRKVNGSLFILAGYYVVIIAVYLFFEKCIVNYRPVLIDGAMEASYPSSHTVITICCMAASAIECRILWNGTVLYRLSDAASLAVTVFTVGGRILSGVHWCTDIIGGLLLSSALVALYLSAVTPCLTKEKETNYDDRLSKRQ